MYTDKKYLLRGIDFRHLIRNVSTIGWKLRNDVP